MSRGQSTELSTRHFDAVVFDLDGVVTQTVRVHASAWKQLFDEYLARLSERTGTPHRPFDLEQDYLLYLDGRPRYEGVRSFLVSRELELPLGDLSDPPTCETICGLGNRKNLLFLSHIRQCGVEVYPSTVEFIHQVRSHKLRIGLITSSKNCSEVLEGAGISDLFETKIDGNDLLRLRLRGKPAPDAFVEACRRLQVAPERTVIVEDAVAGVRAGRAGGFGLVVGVARKDNADDLRENGADVVVTDVGQLKLTAASEARVNSLPHALEVVGSIVSRSQRGLAVFLDYDGTLTPIVARPEQAVMPEATRDTVRRLSKACPVAIISGRDRADVQRLVDIDGIFYAGSHGFDMVGPGGLALSNEQAAHAAANLESMELGLRSELSAVPGVTFERKRFGLAVHWRHAREVDLPRVRHAVDSAVEAVPSLTIQSGRKVFDIVPNLEWHKGRALRWLEDALGLDRGCVVSLYIGDDVTDENAFRELAARGVAIVVRGGLETTTAHFRLEDTTEVAKFLDRLARGLGDKDP
jgi:alpha,alpha-trehalase